MRREGTPRRAAPRKPPPLPRVLRLLPLPPRPLHLLPPPPPLLQRQPLQPPKQRRRRPNFLLERSFARRARAVLALEDKDKRVVVRRLKTTVSSAEASL